MEGGGRRGRSAADRRPAASALLEFRDTIGPWPPPAYVVVRFRRVDRRSTTRVWQPMPLLPRSRPEEPTDMTEEAGPGDRKSTRRTPVTNAHLVCRLLLEKKTKTTKRKNKTQ